jgi:hypothetical protein
LGQIIQTVSENIFKVDIPESPCRTTIQNIIDEAIRDVFFQKGVFDFYITLERSERKQDKVESILKIIVIFVNPRVIVRLSDR